MTTSFTKQHPENLCQFPFSDGRFCRLRVSPSHGSLCVFHARQERLLLDADAIADELASLSSQIRTGHDLNLYLTRLVYFTAAGRLPKRTASTLAFLGSLIRQTLPWVKNEVSIAHGYEEWRELLRRTVPDASVTFDPANLDPEHPPDEPQDSQDPDAADVEASVESPEGVPA